MLFKDASEVHNLAVKLNDPTLFDKVVKGAINDALKRHKAPPSPSTPIGDSDDGGALRVINAKDFPKDIKPRECVVSGIVPEKHITTLYGSSGSTKSILGMSLAMAAARGDAVWLDLLMSGKSYRSVFVDFELDLEAQAARAWQLAKGAGHDELPANFNYITAGGKDPKELFEFLFDYCKNYAVKLLIIDSVGLAMVGDAGAYRDVVTFFRNLDRFRTELGCTIILIDHQANLVGGESYQAKAAFGSSYKGNLSRSRVQVELKEHSPGVRRVAMRHNKANFTEYVDPFEVDVRFSQNSIELKALKMSEGDLVEEEQLTSWKRALLLLYNDDEPKTRDDIRTALNIADGTASNVVARLRKDRYAEFIGDRSGNEQREVVVTQAGKDYVETFLREYREKKSGGGDRGTGDEDEEVPPSPPPTIGSEDDGGACKTPVTATEALFDVIDAIEGVDTVALDLETMPSAGWIWEVVAKYRMWRRGLKNKPKKERMRSAWQEFKEKTYKKYAVDPETAQVRLVSVATHKGLNETIDATAVNIMPLLKVLKNKTLVTHNGSFDLGVLRERYGYVHEGKVLDTEILYLLHHYAEDGKRTKVEGRKRRLPDPTVTNVKVGDETVKMNSLLHVAKKYLDVSLDKENQSADWSVPSLPQRMVDYSLEDSRILLDLKDTLVDKLNRVGMGRIVDLESRALPAIIHMEGNGFPADKVVAEKMAKRYALEAEAALERMAALLPQPEAPDGIE